MDMQPFSIPDALMPMVLGGGIWFGCCYLWISPELTTRAIDIHLTSECQNGANPELCACAFNDIKTGSGHFKNAVFVASFGLLDPRISLFNSPRNPIVEYVSYEMNDRDRRQACRDNNPSSTEADLIRETQRLKDQHDAELETERIAQNKQIEEAKKKAADAIKAADDVAKKAAQEAAEIAKKAVDAAQNCEFGKSDLVGDAERVCKIGTGYTEEQLSWMELGLAKSKQLREKLERKWRLKYE